jgi:hypothetical protein
MCTGACSRSLRMALIEVASSLLCLTFVAACHERAVSYEGRRCRNGECLDGFICHPELQLCVAPFVASCDVGSTTCPVTIDTGDPCPAPGAFVPCLDTVSDCSAGCRTCDSVGQWTECTTPECVLGSVWSCAACDDDCRSRVRHATGAICDVSTATPTCSYAGDCRGGALDADRERANGCECLITNSGIELCDGFDNDCDGAVDEDFELRTECGVGICAGGVLECDPSALDHRCSTMPGGSHDKSRPEICDAHDDDCDGVADNGFPNVCVCDEGIVGPCASPLGPDTGLAICTATRAWGPCVSNWGQRLKVSFDNLDSLEPLLDFPVLVVINDTVAPYARLGWNGASLRFVDADLETLLPYEIELWDPAGDSLVWVRVPQIDAASATDHIWMYYDNAGAVDGQRADEVWSNDYIAVWHLDEDMPGRSSSSTYRDSTGHNHVGVDQVASVNKEGMIGRGQAFASGDIIQVTDAADLAPAGGLTVEMWGKPTDGLSRHLAPITIAPPTQVDGFQVEVQLTPLNFDYSSVAADGADLRFFDTADQSLSYWIETWVMNGTSTVWVRVQSTGTTNLTMVWDSPSVPPMSLATSTLDSGGLWRTTWAATVAFPMDAVAMDTIFADLSFSTRQGWGPVATIDCINACNPYGVDDNYATLIEGWLFANTAGSYGISSDSDAASEITLGGTGWKNAIGGTVVVGYYGAHSLGSFQTGTITLGGWHRFHYRHQESTGGDGYRSGWDLPGPPSSWAIIPSSVLYRRKHADPQPQATVGPVRTIEIGVGRSSSWGLTTSGTTVTGRVNDVDVATTALPGWRYQALTYDRATLRLFVDGQEVGTAPYSLAIATLPSVVAMGDLAPDPRGQGGVIDEVRLSSKARTSSWLRAQYRSMSQDFFVSYGTPELP